MHYYLNYALINLCGVCQVYEDALMSSLKTLSK